MQRKNICWKHIFCNNVWVVEKSEIKKWMQLSLKCIEHILTANGQLIVSTFGLIYSKFRNQSDTHRCKFQNMPRLKIFLIPPPPTPKHSPCTTSYKQHILNALWLRFSLIYMGKKSIFLIYIRKRLRILSTYIVLRILSIYSEKIANFVGLHQKRSQI